jgi:hypothetical protein
VNGTLPNGSDLQPLAQPADLTLDLDQQRALSAFTHAAWSACEAREARYFAFFQVDDEGALWSLTRVSRLGRGARGWVLVAWSALIEREALDALAWPVHRLLPTAFPEARVPARGEQYAPVQVELAPATNAAMDAWRPAFDALVADLGRGPPRLALRIAPPLTGEGAVFGLWSRLGRARADLSFCTWAGLESRSYPPLDRPFHVVVGDGEAAFQVRPRRVERTLAAQVAGRPSLADEVAAYLEGVDFPPRETPSQDPAADAAEVGRRLFERYGDEIARDARATFERLATELALLHESFAPARQGLFDLLRLAASAAPRGVARARVVADFQAGAAPLIASSPGSSRRIVEAALSADALAFFDAAQWAGLGRVLFETTEDGSPPHEAGAIWPLALRALEAAPANEVDWSAVVRLAPRSPRSEPLLRLAAARAWGEAAGQAAFAALEALGPAAVDALADDPRLDRAMRRSMLATIARGRRPGDGLIGKIRYQRQCLALRARLKTASAAA